MMSYDDVIKKLYSNQDFKYKDFSSKIILSNNMIGVKTPILKSIAKEIAGNNYEEFLTNNTHKTFEEDMLHGLILGYLKINYEDLIKLLNNFLPYINNWAVCDQTAANLKVFKKYDELGFEEIKKYIQSNNPWINRFGYVLLNDHYVSDKWIEKIFELCSNYKDEYYIKMSIAWLISTCYIKDKNKTIVFLKNNKLDDWTYNKAIQKIIESKRISIQDKNILREMKRK